MNDDDDDDDGRWNGQLYTAIYISPSDASSMQLAMCSSVYFRCLLKLSNLETARLINNSLFKILQRSFLAFAYPLYFKTASAAHGKVRTDTVEPL